MSIEEALKKAQSSVPECLGIGYVDMSTGLLLGVRTVDSHPDEVLDLVAAASADLFQGGNVLIIEDLFKHARGVASNDHYFKEIIMFSENMLHVFIRSKAQTDHVAVFVTRASANIGMVLSKSRIAVPLLEKAFED